MSAGSPMKRSLAALRRAEEASQLLRGLGAPRPLLVADRLAVADPSLANVLPIEPPHEAPLPAPGLPPVRADAVLVGRADNYLRLRAFYLDARLSIAIHHGWPPRILPSNLHRGAAVRQRLVAGGLGDGRLTAPRPLEQGRGLLGAWLLEEMLPGRTVNVEEWPALAPLVAVELIGASLASDSTECSLEEVLPPASLRQAIDEIERQHDLGLDVQGLVHRARKLVGSEGRVVVAPTHGDPGRRNVISMQDGGLGLVDWEAARVRLVAHDLIKAVEDLDDPVAAVDTIASGLPPAAPRSISWSDQAAVACLARVAGSRRWLSRSRVASLLGRSAVSARAARNRQLTIRLLDRLLASSR
ncbi:MAG TPA: phosphotransferase [Candidatus Limnocylindrales bacterium]|nr:phosphotransferase [Candidatus Limnocylindrales bacterium]